MCSIIGLHGFDPWNVRTWGTDLVPKVASIVLFPGSPLCGDSNVSPTYRWEPEQDYRFASGYLEIRNHCWRNQHSNSRKSYVTWLILISLDFRENTFPTTVLFGLLRKPPLGGSTTPITSPLPPSDFSKCFGSTSSALPHRNSALLIPDWVEPVIVMLVQYNALVHWLYTIQLCIDFSIFHGLLHHLNSYHVSDGQGLQCKQNTSFNSSGLTYV